MKKLLLITLSILSCGAIHALPLGNPCDASLLTEGVFCSGHCADICDDVAWCDALSVRLGFYGDYVFDRHMGEDHHCGNLLEKTRIYTNAAYLAANLFDRLDLFATLGGTNFLLTANSSIFSDFAGSEGSDFTIETETDFSWSIGTRATIWECGCTCLGFEAQYFYTDPHVSRIERDQTNFYLPNSVKLRYREWQVGFGLAHRINLLVPYAGIKFAHSKANFDNASLLVPNSSPPERLTLRTLRSDNCFGYVFGVSFIGCEKAALTTEVRFNDEKALYVNGMVRF